METRPENTQYIAVVLGTSGEAYGYVTLMISDKLRTLLKLIPLPKKMSQTPDQAEEFNVYSYLKQLIDGNDVGVLLRVADEVVSVMDTVSAGKQRYQRRRVCHVQDQAQDRKRQPELDSGCPGQHDRL